ncbi:MAG: glycogen debranching N-terminal domain-containing protein [Sphingomicrobium sp.]
MNDVSDPPTPDVSVPVSSDYHIEATESLVERTLRTLKHDDLFAVFDQQGNLQSGPDGIYFRDTRYLSLMALNLGGVEPLQLGSVLLDDNVAMVVDATNADLHTETGQTWLQRESIHIQRFKFLKSETAFERIRLRSFTPIGRAIPLEMRFATDFADLFEVRGTKRAARGVVRARRTNDRTIEYRYRGLDHVERCTRLRFEPAPDHLSTNGAAWSLDLDATGGEAQVLVRIECASEGAEFPDVTAPAAYRDACRSRKNQRKGRADITSSSSLFDALIARAWSDLDMLTTETPWGAYPYAGVPWYSTVFGRDGIITAMQMLWCAPYIARGVLGTLAVLQATEADPAADAQPGKILHEMRDGEMARLGEVPFRRYYGTVDATPLFVMLAGQYYERSGDLDFIRSIWPNVKAALAWIDDFGDMDGDGFVEYARMTDTGLTNQGWKDSSDSIFHDDGRLAHGPIALVEVQAYVFSAKQGAAILAEALGETKLADTLRNEAEVLRRKFEEAFWVEEIGTYAIALDGAKQPCKIASSNAGHALFCGIASPERARRVADQLIGNRFFTGWGVRTIPTGAARYNPMSYHNGSVWPHDNALIAMGFARYGFKNEVERLFKGMIEAASYDDLRRLPELFCGFPRRRRQGPTSYPVACSPQAWAAGTLFAMLGAACGIKVNAQDNSVVLDNPILPTALSKVEFAGITVGDCKVSLRFSRDGDDVTVSVDDRVGFTKVTIRK